MSWGLLLLALVARHWWALMNTWTRFVRMGAVLAAPVRCDRFAPSFFDVQPTQQLSLPLLWLGV